MQPTRPRMPRLPRALVAVLFAMINSGNEAFKIVAGYGQRPDASELWSLVAVTLLSGSLAWIAAPAIAARLALKKSLGLLHSRLLAELDVADNAAAGRRLDRPPLAVQARQPRLAAWSYL
ncbi:hypothetical protein [Actinoplanes xinjiangensis]|uniref:hypothetical protein n=1 Tax=Actinoplanes xinjiangensis TaxID=512350 RepID=UPI0034396803